MEQQQTLESSLAIMPFAHPKSSAAIPLTQYAGRTFVDTGIASENVHTNA